MLNRVGDESDFLLATGGGKDVEILDQRDIAGSHVKQSPRAVR